MRYVRLTLSPADGAFHPVERLLTREGYVERVKLLHVRLLADDSVVGLYSGVGDREALATVLDEHSQVWESDVFETDGLVYAYLHLAPGEPVGSLLSIVEEYRLILDTPMVYDEDGLTLTVLGEHGIEREAIQSIPAEIDVEIHRLGEYNPEDGGILPQLTDRQREVLDVAVRAGYYAVPREATHEDVAAALGCAPSTASEHLRRIESRIMNALLARA